MTWPSSREIPVVKIVQVVIVTTTMPCRFTLEHTHVPMQNNYSVDSALHNQLRLLHLAAHVRHNTAQTRNPFVLYTNKYTVHFTH